MLEFVWPWFLLLLAAPFFLQPKKSALSKPSKALRIPFFNQLEAAAIKGGTASPGYAFLLSRG